MPAPYWIRLGGLLPATAIAAHTPPTWETLADGGIGEVSFEFSLSPKAQHPLLNDGVKVEVMLGATPLATAEMTEPDRTTWQVKAFGLSSAGRRIAAFDALGNPSRDVGMVLLNTTANGWAAKFPDEAITGGGVVSGDSTEPQMVGSLLDAYCEQTGQRWGVDGTGRVYIRSDPTTPTYFISPDAAAFGVTGEDQATQLILRYQTAGGAYATTKYPTVDPPVIRHEMVDLTGRGALTEAEVHTIAAGAMKLGKGRASWTNGVTLSREQITFGGAPASLALVTAGAMARATGLPAAYLTQAPWLDVVIGKTRHTAGSETIYLEPVNTAPRGFVDVIAAA